VEGDGKIRRRVTETSTETVYLITSLTAREAGPEHIAAYIRNHRGIANNDVSRPCGRDAGMGQRPAGPGGSR
jgi:hypothetical protein